MSGEVTQEPAATFEAPGSSVIQRIPVVLLTGFLGSGKTTLLRSILGGQSAPNTAVIVNEFGAVGLDHLLMWRSEGVVELVENGCVCCDVGEDLLLTMEQLFHSRLRRKIPRFERLLIETTGLADPRHVMQALRAHPLVSERYRLTSVICTVDAAQANDRLFERTEALAQVTSADLIFLTKGDLVSDEAASSWKERLAVINPAAEIVPVRSDAFPFNLLDYFERNLSLGCKPRGSPLRQPSLARAKGTGRHAVQVVTISLPDAVEEAAIAAAFQAVLAALGERILRLKGVVRLRGRPGAWILQAAGSRMFPLEGAPGFESPGFMVLIFEGTQADVDEVGLALQPLSTGTLPSP